MSLSVIWNFVIVIANKKTTRSKLVKMIDYLEIVALSICIQLSAPILLPLFQFFFLVIASLFSSREK